MKQTLLQAGKILLGLAASGGLGWLAIRGLDWGLVAESMGGVSVGLLLAAVAVFMFASYLRAYRWQILFVKDRISVLRLFVIQNEGIGLNNLMPLRVASEPMQMAILSIRERISIATALATLGMERVIDLVASALLLAVAFFLVPEMKNFTPYVWGAIGFAVVAIVFVRLLAWGSGALTLVGRFAFLSAFLDAVRGLERERARLAASLFVSILYWLLVGITSWTVAAAIDMSLSLMTATLVTMGTIFFATAVPAAPSALGTFEWAVVYVLGFFGVEREGGIAFAFIIHAVFFLPPTIIAVVFLPREGIVSVRSVRRLLAGGAGSGAASRGKA